MSKKIDLKQTARNIVDKCNSNIGLSINIEKFNKKLNNKRFLLKAAKFTGAQIAYKDE